MFEKFSSLSFSCVGWRKPARDLEFTTHHRPVVAINGEVLTFKDNEGVRLLNIIKKMNKLGPVTAGLDGSENGLMIRGCLAGADGRVLDDNVVFTGDLFELIEQSRGLLGALERRLSFLQPLIAFGPELALFQINGLLRAGGFARGQLTP